MKMEHVRIPGRIGRWSSVESIERYGVKWYTMENDTYGDAAELVVVDEDRVEHAYWYGPLEEVVDDVVDSLIEAASRPLDDAVDEEEREELEWAREWCRKHEIGLMRVATE